jgi:hypothetical protein
MTPLISTSCSVAPLLVLVIEPLRDPTEAEALMRASIAVVVTVPSVSLSVNDECQVLPLSSEISTPAGAVISILAVSELPPTV